MPRRFRPAVPFAVYQPADGSTPRQWPRTGASGGSVGSDAPGAVGADSPGSVGSDAPPPAYDPTLPPTDDPAGAGRPADPAVRGPFDGLPIPHKTWQTKNGSQITVAGCCLPLPLLVTAGTAVVAAALRRSRR